MNNTTYESDECTDREYRCPKCSKLLLKGDVNLVHIKCPRCKNIITFRK